MDNDQQPTNEPTLSPDINQIPAQTPVPKPPVKMSSKVKIFLFATVSVLVLAILGVLGYTYWNDSVQPKDAPVNSQKVEQKAPVTNPPTLEGLKDKLSELPNKSTRQNLDSSVTLPGTESDVTIVTKSDFTAAYGDIVSGSEPVDANTIVKVLTDEGLKLAKRNVEGVPMKPGLRVEDFYDSSTVSCSLSYLTPNKRIGIVAVSCIEHATLKLTQQSVTDVLSIAQADLPAFTLKKGYNHTFVRNDDGILWVRLNFSDQLAAYYAKVPDGQWTYLASDTAGEQGYIPPSCDQITRKPFGNIFDFKQC
jgi:hypothetical protein